jgi:elongation factor 2
MAKTLTDDFGWDPNDAKKVWCFGPEFSGSNLLVD